MNTQFVATTAKLSNDILRQKFRIGAGHIYIGIGHMQITIQHIFKLIDHLHLIQENVVHLIINEHRINVLQKFVGIAKFRQSPILQVDTDNMIGIDTFAL